MTSTNPNQFDNTTGQTQPTLYENVTNTVSNAAQAAYKSIPSVKPDASTHTPDTSLPTREHEGAQPFERTGGVGALPGSLGETSVAKLPEQRAAEIPRHPPTDQHPVATTTNSIPHPSNPAAGGHGFSPATGEHGSSITSGQHGSTLTSTGVNVNPSVTTDLPPYPPRGAPSQTPAQPGTFGSTTQTAYNSLPQPVKNTAERANDPAQPGLVQKAKDAFLGATGLGAAQVHHSLPSQETEGVKPGEHHDGVGPLPGRLDDTSVAKLPAEREDPNPLSRPHHATQPPLSAERSEHGINPLSADARFDATHGSHPSADRTRGTDPLHAAAHPIATAEKHTTDRPTDRAEDRGEHRTNPLQAAAHPIATAEKHTTDRPRERTEGTGEHRPLHAAAHPIDTAEKHTTDRPREHTEGTGEHRPLHAAAHPVDTAEKHTTDRPRERTEGTGEHRPLHAAAHPVDTAERHTTDRPREHTEGTGEHRPLHAAAHPVDTAERHTGTHPTDRATDRTEHRDEHRTDHPMEGVERIGDTEGTTKVPLKDKIKGEMKILSGHLTSHAAKVDEGRAIKKGTASTAH